MPVACKKGCVAAVRRFLAHGPFLPWGSPFYALQKACKSKSKRAGTVVRMLLDDDRIDPKLFPPVTYTWDDPPGETDWLLRWTMRCPEANPRALDAILEHKKTRGEHRMHVLNLLDMMEREYTVEICARTVLKHLLKIPNLLEEGANCLRFSKLLLSLCKKPRYFRCVRLILSRFCWHSNLPYTDGLPYTIRGGCVYFEAALRNGNTKVMRMLLKDDRFDPTGMDLDTCVTHVYECGAEYGASALYMLAKDGRATIPAAAIRWMSTWAHVTARILSHRRLAQRMVLSLATRTPLCARNKYLRGIDRTKTRRRA